MSETVETIEKGFLVPTRNLLFLPDDVSPSERLPLVVALHGMGMNAEEFAGLLAPIRDLRVALFVPEGVYPFEIRTAGQFRIGRSWYLYTGDDDEFVASMRKTVRHLRTLIDRAMVDHPIDPGNVVLLGFSQGGYFAGYAGIRSAARLRGLVVIGARVKDEVLEHALPRATDLPVLLMHGRRDRSVPFELATQSLFALKDAGVPAELRWYDCGHHVTAEQVRDVKAWLGELLG